MSRHRAGLSHLQVTVRTVLDRIYGCLAHSLSALKVAPGVTTIPSKLSPRVLFADGTQPAGVLSVAAAAPTRPRAQVTVRIFVQLDGKLVMAMA